MAFLIDAAYLPAILTAPPMTDEQFAELVSEHPDLFFEMSAEGELIVMPPPYSLTGIRQGKIFAQLNTWAEEDGRGIAGEATTGFVLPNGARRSPDAAWIRKDRVRELDPKMIERYWHLCPDFLIEMRSHTDRLRTLRDKMHEWIDNGAQLAWMIDPETRGVEIYRPDAEPKLLNDPERLFGEGPVEGFTLVLAPIWDPLNS
ncbi:MAG: Uma2 family endonuclease [Acidobacteriaceae bacterium]|nr:Uma2 family endonuclease [Acidobacteriaceae bacterium]